MQHIINPLNGQGPLTVPKIYYTFLQRKNWTDEVYKPTLRPTENQKTGVALASAAATGQISFILLVLMYLKGESRTFKYPGSSVSGYVLLKWVCCVFGMQWIMKIALAAYWSIWSKQCVTRVSLAYWENSCWSSPAYYLPLLGTVSTQAVCGRLLQTQPMLCINLLHVHIIRSQAARELSFALVHWSFNRIGLKSEFKTHVRLLTDLYKNHFLSNYPIP